MFHSASIHITAPTHHFKITDASKPSPKQVNLVNAQGSSTLHMISGLVTEPNICVQSHFVVLRIHLFSDLRVD